MTTLLIVGGGLFGSLASAYARSMGIETLVFDPGLQGGASHAAAGLFKEEWAGKKSRAHFERAIDVLDQLFEIRQVTLTYDDKSTEEFLFVPPTDILDPCPIKEKVTAVGDGWLEANGRRYEGYVYIAAGIWCEQFLPGLGVYGKTGVSFAFHGEREGRIRPLSYGRQAIAFVRNPGYTFFSDGTAEAEYSPDHEQKSLELASSMGLTGRPVQRFWGHRPYTPKGPVFRKLSQRTWLATGGRKMGTILGASFAKTLVDKELT